MSFSVGQKVKTRNGLDAVILEIDDDPNYPIWFAYRTENEFGEVEWEVDGARADGSAYSTGKHDLDLIDAERRFQAAFDACLTSRGEMPVRFARDALRDAINAWENYAK